MHRRSTVQHLLALLLTSTISLSAAYPELFVESGLANGCTDIPTSGLGAHGDPALDRSITFTLSKSGSTQQEKGVCPGISYDLVVDYAGKRRRTLITASAGQFSSPGKLPADPTCPNRAASGGASSTYTNKITLPCTVKDSQLVLNVASAANSGDNFHTATTKVPISALAQCPGSTCPGAATATAPAATPVATPATTPAAAPAAATTAPAAQTKTPAAATQPAAPAEVDDDEPAAKVFGKEPGAPPGGAASLQRSTGGGCQASSFKYACAVNANSGATLHYTLSDSPTPPDNVCTASAAAAPGGSSAGGQYLHMLLESPAQGYSGVGFPSVLGRMYPTDAVIGYVNSATGQPVVSAYHLTSFSVTKAPGSTNGLGWASALGAAKSGGKSLLCFSRPVEAPTAAVAKSLDTSALKLTWVGDSSTNYGPQTHAYVESLTLNAADGTATGAGASSKLAKQLAHGALMLLAFSVFMPLGALMARHKWIMGDMEKGGIKAGWFHVHRAVQCLAVLLALAGFILAVVSFSVPWSDMAPGTAPHELYNAHRVLGVIVMILSLLQVVGGIMRPTLNHARRPNWRAGHTLMGWLALAAGTAVVFMGAVMIHDMSGQPYINWLLPICLFLGLVLVAGVVAEVFKSKLERQGLYDPSTHTFLHSPPSSARSSATGAPEVEIVGGTAAAKEDMRTHML